MGNVVALLVDPVGGGALGTRFLLGGGLLQVFFGIRKVRSFKHIITYDNEGLSLSSRHYCACISFINRFTLEKECL